MAFNDAFTGTDGVDLPTYDANWVTPTGGTTCELSGNTACATTNDGTFCSNYYNQTFAEAHYAIATTHVGLTGFSGVIVRAAAGSTDCYYAFVNGGTGVGFAGQRVSGTNTNWDSGIAGFVAGDTIELHADPDTTTTWYLKKNGTTIETYTGKNALSGGKAGVVSFNVQAGQEITAWEGGDVAGGGATAKPFSYYQRMQLGN